MKVIRAPWDSRRAFDQSFTPNRFAAVECMLRVVIPYPPEPAGHPRITPMRADAKSRWIEKKIVCPNLAHFPRRHITHYIPPCGWRRRQCPEPRLGHRTRNPRSIATAPAKDVISVGRQSGRNPRRFTLSPTARRLRGLIGEINPRKSRRQIHQSIDRRDSHAIFRDFRKLQSSHRLNQRPGSKRRRPAAVPILIRRRNLKGVWCIRI